MRREEHPKLGRRPQPLGKWRSGADRAPPTVLGSPRNTGQLMTRQVHRASEAEIAPFRNRYRRMDSVCTSVLLSELFCRQRRIHSTTAVPPTRRLGLKNATFQETHEHELWF